MSKYESSSYQAPQVIRDKSRAHTEGLIPAAGICESFILAPWGLESLKWNTGEAGDTAAGHQE